MQPIYLKKKFMMTLGILHVGCVGIHPSEMVDNVDKNYAVSCAKDPRIETVHFLSFACTVENMSDTWLTFKFEAFKLQSLPQAPKVLSPDELIAFTDAYSFQRQMEDYNTSLLLNGLVVGGIIAAAAGGTDVANTGAAIALGASAVSMGREIKNKQEKIQYGNIYGPTHILGEEFKIPPGMFVRRNIILEINNSELKIMQKSKAHAELCSKLPKVECLKVPLGFYDHSS